MGGARDIALIFLSLEALVIALIPLVLVSGLAYGIYRLHRLTRTYLQLAQVYAQQANDAVGRASRAVAEPLIRAHAAWCAGTAVLTYLIRRIRKHG